MRFKHRDGWVSGQVALELRTRVEVDDHSVFEIPEDLQDDVALLQRLVDAGHEPADPDALPDAVELDGSQSGSDSEDDVDEADGEADGSEVSEAVETPADGEDALVEMDRSDLWEVAHSDEFDAEPEISWNESTAEGLRSWIRDRRDQEGS